MSIDKLLDSSMKQSIVKLVSLLSALTEISQALSTPNQPFAVKQSTGRALQLPSVALVSLLHDKENVNNNRVEIDAAIEDLVGRRVSFDPLECLSGPFFASVYQQVRAQHYIWSMRVISDFSISRLIIAGFSFLYYLPIKLGSSTALGKTEFSKE